jgi:hypothetical protein
LDLKFAKKISFQNFGLEALLRYQYVENCQFAKHLFGLAQIKIQELLK